MLNLYLAPKNGRVLPELALQNAEDVLRGYGLIGDAGSDGEFVPGNGVARLYNRDAHDDLLPAELTFDGLRIVHRPRPFFLPMHQPVDGFADPVCGICGDGVDLDMLDESLAYIAFKSVDRFTYTCPCCRSELRIDQIDFGQTVAVASQWIFIEGAGTSRLNTKIIDALSRAMGTVMVVVPEVPEDDLEDWAPAHQRRGRW